MTQTPDRDSALAQIKADLSSIAIAPNLRENVRQHYEHLEMLTASLKTLGLENRTIDAHVGEIFKHYKAELLRSLEKPGARKIEATIQ